MNVCFRVAERYRGLNGEVFATRVNADLAVAHDQHLSLRYDPEMAVELGVPPKMTRTRLFRPVSRAGSIGGFPACARCHYCPQHPLPGL